jgi:hypothetical protein
MVLSSTDLSSLSALLPENALGSGIHGGDGDGGDMGHQQYSSETQHTHFEFDEQTLRSLQQFMESQGLHPHVCP